MYYQVVAIYNDCRAQNLQKIINKIEFVDYKITGMISRQQN